MTMAHQRVFEVPRAVYPFDDHWLDIDDLTLHYVDEGTGPTLLFFHGNPTWSLLYRAIIPALSDAYRCVCVDYPGYGFSERPPKEQYDYLPETHSALMERVVDTLGLTDFVSFHQDWGGPIGLGLAGRRPELVRGLVIGNTWAFPIDEDPRFAPTCQFSRTMGAPENQENVIEQNAFLNVATPLLRQGQDQRDATLGDAVAAAYNAPWSKPEWRYPTWIAPNQIASGRAYIEEVERGLAALRDTPTLLFWGEQDPVCVPALCEKFQELLPNHRVVRLPEASHFIQEDEPDTIAREMRAFLQELAASPAGRAGTA